VGVSEAAPILFTYQQSAEWLPKLAAFMNRNNIHSSVIDQKTGSDVDNVKPQACRLPLVSRLSQPISSAKDTR